MQFIQLLNVSYMQKCSTAAIAMATEEMNRMLQQGKMSVMPFQMMFDSFFKKKGQGPCLDLPLFIFETVVCFV